jgi:polyribonucleotide nucleotidyltransferase
LKKLEESIEDGHFEITISTSRSEQNLDFKSWITQIWPRYKANTMLKGEVLEVRKIGDGVAIYIGREGSKDSFHVANIRPAYPTPLKIKILQHNLFSSKSQK